MSGVFIFQHKMPAPFLPPHVFHAVRWRYPAPPAADEYPANCGFSVLAYVLAGGPMITSSPR